MTKPASETLKRILLFILCTLPAALLSAQETEDSLIRISNFQIGKLYKPSAFRRVSVHDPSIAAYTAASGRRYYYVFGSHLGVAYSTDLKNWTGKYDANNCNGMFGKIGNTGAVEKLSTYTDAYRTNQTKRIKILSGNDTVEADFGNFDASAWNTSSGQALGGVMWAPDIIYNPHLEKWCMYMSLNGDNWRSVIVLLTSTGIAGPYIYQGPVVYSGFQWTSIPEASWKLTDLELVIGTQSSLPARYNLGNRWGQRWPNSIDPCVFFDEKGELWMSYGSWSGGIFILKLDAKSGLRDYTTAYQGVNNNSDKVISDPYFGKRIAGGFYVSGEGSYIQRIGNHYFLFVTNGGLTADGGYEMHVFRSEAPDGPYIDSKGNSAVYPEYQMNYGPNSAGTRGEKILGAYQWDNMATAELSQGHNSAFVDEDGNAYIIYHTRFNDGTEGHAVRVHQLFLNEEGWLLAAPYEYAGSNINQDTIANKSCCTVQEIAGCYQIIQHKYKMNYASKAYQRPFNIRLHENGTVSGDYGGTWKQKEGTSYFSIVLKSNLSSTKTQYSGVILPQTVSQTNMKAVSFSAVSTGGVSLWGSNADGQLAVDYNYQNYTAPLRTGQRITTDIDLTAEMSYGATLQWSSDREDVIGSDGKVTLPDNDSVVSVQMTYTITKDRYYYNKNITVKVKGDGTGIAPIRSGEAATGKETPIYRLNGLRIKEITEPGLYIIDGKKVFTK